MNAKKKNNLEKTYERFLNVGFCVVPYEDLSDIIVSEPMVYGTAKEEKILSFEGVEALFKSQYEQMGNMNSSYERERIVLQVSEDENNACIIEELTLKFSSAEKSHRIFMRTTCLMSYIKGKWKLTHWHASSPVNTENDPWHMQKLQREKEKLKQLVNQQTAVLKQNNRELQIEAALENIRAQTMAMHNSEDIDKCIVKMFDELTTLGVPHDTRVGIGILNHDNERSKLWTATKHKDQVNLHKGSISMTWHPLLKIARKAWLEQVQFHEYVLEGEDLHKYYKVLNDAPDYPLQIDVNNLPERQFHYGFIFDHGFFYALSNYELEDQLIHITQRFSNLYAQTYTRYLDLKKGEEQAREFEIETALEKVRSVALSLLKPDDMLDIAKVLYEQLYKLGFSKIRNAIIDIHNEEDESFLDYDYSPEMSTSIAKISFYSDPVTEQQIKKTKSSDDAFFEIELRGKELKQLIKKRIENGEKDDPRLHQIDILTYNMYSFGNGAIGISNFGVLSDDQKKLLKRFRNVFTFAYKRYTDLANTEAQAKEAKIEASLERVRSVALGIEESSDLLEIVKAFYEQLLHLGFNDIRNAIIDVNNEDEQTFLDYDYSHEMGGTITLMAYDDDPSLVEQVKDIAKTTDGYSEMIFEGQKLKDLIEMRRKNGEADDPRLMKADSLTYILYAFGNGAMGISNFGNLDKEKKNILSRFSGVFAFAYKRFKDLKEKEEKSAALLEEKILLEKTLVDLKETQNQLIQSEKMASLGELTAGIAHEIQNPLNFVNNFSEVSKELIEEMKEEIENGDFEEVSAIMEDVIQNLEKINHHGKRADGIVKGMLQHSRTGGDKKQPTDINALADEYIRLAYHGLRAKDKSFNAEIITDFDENLEPVMVVSQDIGRVILNLLTNAFYACNERLALSASLTGRQETEVSRSAKKNKNDITLKEYKPKVTVQTKKTKNNILIEVTDNGNGIPDKVKDKIFQPFFTTKPTGQGTGLGLSMSYEIITKGHGGELKVESIEEKGTIFTVEIPIIKNNQSS